MMVLRQVGEPERPADPGGGEVADGHGDVLAARLGPELGDHGRRQVDAVHPHAPAAERDGDAAGADAQLERGASCSPLGQELDRGIDDRRVEQLRPPGLAGAGDRFVEVVLGHGCRLAGRRGRHQRFAPAGRPEVRR
jgi:hypothetical protein